MNDFNSCLQACRRHGEINPHVNVLPCSGKNPGAGASLHLDKWWTRRQCWNKDQRSSWDTQRMLGTLKARPKLLNRSSLVGRREGSVLIWVSLWECSGDLCHECELLWACDPPHLDHSRHCLCYDLSVIPSSECCVLPLVCPLYYTYPINPA